MTIFRFARNEDIYFARLEGMKYQEIADIHNLSISRINTICRQVARKRTVELRKFHDPRLRLQGNPFSRTPTYSLTSV